ncbi:MAG: aminotransferase class I/II-fold pyridoxal phosphate-dependent enzyme [Eubacterium sp.]
MEFQLSKRLDAYKTSIFTTLDQKKEELLQKGRKVYNLSIGTPDFEPEEHIKQALIEAAKDSKNWKYAVTDSDELIKSVISYYQKRFNVQLNENEIMSLYGSQEGIAHIGLALCDIGDIVLVPNPGYQIFKIGPMLSGANCIEYPLLEENNFLPDLDNIDSNVADAAKFIVVSYPSNPVCAVATDEFYMNLIKWAKEHNIIILHDNAYSDIIYGEKTAGSFLRFPDAKDIAIEYFSLSKSFNVTGARISFAVGNHNIIQQFKMVRSQIDYGMFLPIQKAAVAALTGPLDAIVEQGKEYERRMKALCGGLRSIGWDVPDSQGTMFVWAHIPAGFSSSREFVFELMDKTGVICVPGDSFGTLGEGYVRFALVLPVSVIEELVSEIDKSGIIKK